jgi:hypothetical protein
MERKQGVYVRAYTRKDGTHVRGHYVINPYARRPQSRTRDRRLLVAAFVCLLASGGAAVILSITHDGDDVSRIATTGLSVVAFLVTLSTTLSRDLLRRPSHDNDLQDEERGRE